MAFSGTFLLIVVSLVTTTCFFLVKDSVVLLCECFDSYEMPFSVFAETISFIEISWSSCFCLRRKSIMASFSITTSSTVDIRVSNSSTTNSELSQKSDLFLSDILVSAFLFSSSSNVFLLIFQML